MKEQAVIVLALLVLLTACKTNDHASDKSSILPTPMTAKPTPISGPSITSPSETQPVQALAREKVDMLRVCSDAFLLIGRNQN